MHDTRPTQLVPYNPRWSIPEELQEVLDICLCYQSTKRGTAQALSQHKGLAAGSLYCSVYPAPVSMWLPSRR